MTLAEIADVVGGTLHDCDPAATVTSTVEFDSRRVAPGGLFVAVPGERVDGHDFAPDAVAAGAVGVLAAREVNAPAVIVPPVTPGNPGALALAGDTDGAGAAVLAAMAALARHVASSLTDLTIVGITGSAGKTSTKDLVAALLEPMGPMVAPPGSFNNELGYPWTVLRCDERTRYLVLELSARGTGHIAALCRIARPHIGVVLNVGTAHLGEFGSRENIAKAKGELVEALPSAADGGVAVLNADDELVAAMAARTSARILPVGESGTAVVRAEDVRLDEQARASFTLRAPEGEGQVALTLHGAHYVGNALAAAAVALRLGATPDGVCTGLSRARAASGKRMEVTTRGDGVTVINDAYNSSPEAVRSALKSLVTMAAGRAGARSWAVLGPMGELGDAHDDLHAEVGRLAVRLDVSRLVVVGEQAAQIHHGAGLEGSWGEESVLVPDIDAAVTLLRAELRAPDVVLVKAANVHRFWRLAARLLPDDGDRW